MWHLVQLIPHLLGIFAPEISATIHIQAVTLPDRAFVDGVAT